MPRGFSEEDIQKVREANDLVAIVGERTPVRRRGHDFWCCCPFHQEKTPSMKIDPDLQLWHCFGCGEGGDLFSFVMKSEDVSFPEAVRLLARRANIEIDEGSYQAESGSKSRLRAVCAETASFYHTQLMRNPSDEAGKARTYLAGRGFGGEVPKRWNLGFAPGRQALVNHLRSKGFTPEEMMQANVAMKSENGMLRDRFFNRIMFPIYDAQGDCIAFGGRVIGQGEPKYLNSQETPLFHKSRVLYGLDKAKTTITSTGIAVIVEGYTDVISLHEAGLTNAVATLGTALTISHIRLLSRYAKHRIVYLFDGDAAGQRAADRALGFIDESMTPEAGQMRVELCAVTLPDNLDPAEFVSAHGADELHKLIDDAEPLLKYGIDRRLAAHDTSTPEGRTRALVDSLAVLAPIKNSLLAKDYATQIAGRLHMREQDVLEQLAKTKPPRQSSYDNAAQEPVVSQTMTASQQESASLPEAEINRRRFEMQLLGMAYQRPELALSHANALGQTNWHDPENAKLAKALLGALAENPNTDPATLIARAAEVVPRSAAKLTSVHGVHDGDASEKMDYLAEELAIGDLEQTADELIGQLQDASSLQGEDYDLVFKAVAELQKEIAGMRAKHRPI